MKWDRTLKTVRPYLLPVLVLALIIAFYSFCVGRVQTEFPVLRPQALALAQNLMKNAEK